MLIDFKNIPEVVSTGLFDGEKDYISRFYQDEKTKIIYGKLVPGASIGMHTHAVNCEVMYILEGTGKALYNGEYLPLSAGSCHYCPKGHAHSLINDSDKDLVFFAVIPVQ